jgi:hypothetical protein
MVHFIDRSLFGQSIRFSLNLIRPLVGQVVLLYCVRWLNLCDQASEYTQKAIDRIDRRIRLSIIHVEDSEVNLISSHTIRHAANKGVGAGR